MEALLGLESWISWIFHKMPHNWALSEGDYTVGKRRVRSLASSKAGNEWVTCTIWERGTWLSMDRIRKLIDIIDNHHIPPWSHMRNWHRWSNLATIEGWCYLWELRIEIHVYSLWFYVTQLAGVRETKEDEAIFEVILLYNNWGLS